MRNVDIQRHGRTAVRPYDGYILQIPAPRIRRLAQQEYTFLRILEERVDGVFAEVGAERDAVCAQAFERGPGVGFRGRGDVAAFGVQDDGDQRAESIRFSLYRFDDLLERRPTVCAEDFEEGGVGLEGRSVGRGLFNEIQAKVQGGFGGGRFQVGNVRVESHAQQRGAIVDALFEKGEEGFHISFV